MNDFYLAGPFFDDNQLSQQVFIENIFRLANKTFFSPRLDAGKLPKKPSKKDLVKIFNKDLEGINNCKCLFANVSHRDTGTSVEIGYALSRDIPVILFWDKDDNTTFHVNLMIAAACGGKVIQNKSELVNYLRTGELPDNELQFNVD